MHFQGSLLLSFLLSLFSLNSMITTMITPLKILCIALPLSFYHTCLAKSLASDNPKHPLVCVCTCALELCYRTIQLYSRRHLNFRITSLQRALTVTGKSTKSLVNSIHQSSEHLTYTFPSFLIPYFPHPFPLPFCS